MKSARNRCRSLDGGVHIDRWGFESRFGGILLHKMVGPDPRYTLHDHSWWFTSLVLWGGYIEQRASVRSPSDTKIERHKPFSVRAMRLDQCHRITALLHPMCLTLVLHGPVRQTWGCYTADRWVWWRDLAPDVVDALSD